MHVMTVGLTDNVYDYLSGELCKGASTYRRNEELLNHAVATQAAVLLEAAVNQIRTMQEAETRSDELLKPLGEMQQTDETDI